MCVVCVREREIGGGYAIGRELGNHAFQCPSKVLDCAIYFLSLQVCQIYNFGVKFL